MALKRKYGAYRRTASAAISAIGGLYKRYPKPRGKPFNVQKSRKKSRRGSSTGNGRKTQTISAQSFSGLTFSRAYYGRRKKNKLLKSMTAPCNIYQNDNRILDSGQTGLQAVGYNLANIPPSMSSQNLNFLYTQARAYGSAPPGIDFATRGYKLYLDNTEDITMISNLTVTSCTVDIYDIVCTNMATASLPDPIIQWNQGLRQDQGSATVDFPERIVGAVPYSSPLFTRYSKVVKQTKVEMPPGSCHEHKWKHYIGRSFDMSDSVFTGDSSYTTPLPVTNLKGLTHYTMCVVKGVVVAATKAGTAATTSDTRVAIVTTRRSAVRLLGVSPRITNFTNTLLADKASTQTYYNPGSGIIDTGLNEA